MTEQGSPADPLALDQHPVVVAAREALDSAQAARDKLTDEAQRARIRVEALAADLTRIEDEGDTAADYVGLHRKLETARVKAEAAELKTRPAEGAVRVAKNRLHAAYAEAALEGARAIADELRAQVPTVWEAVEDLATVAKAFRAPARGWRQAQAMVERAQDQSAWSEAWPMHPTLEWAGGLDHDTLRTVERFVQEMRTLARRPHHQPTTTKEHAA